MPPKTDQLDNVRLQRAYDEPQPDDGHRVLVDRVWPRGTDEGRAAARRVGARPGPEHWPSKVVRARSCAVDRVSKRAIDAELAEPERAQALDALAAIARDGRVTIVYGARDREHNQAQVIADEIARRLAVAP